MISQKNQAKEPSVSRELAIDHPLEGVRRTTNADNFFYS